MNRSLVNSKLDKYRARGKGTYSFCQVGCDCNIAVNLLEEKENLQTRWDSLREWLYTNEKNIDKNFIVVRVKDVLDKMNELEGSDKDGI